MNKTVDVVLFRGYFLKVCDGRRNGALLHAQAASLSRKYQNSAMGVRQTATSDGVASTTARRSG